MLLAGAVLIVSSACPAGTAGTDTEPPLAGRPTNFSGAIGSYRVTMRAAPTDVQVGDPLTLTIHITGTGALDRLQRPDLRGLPRFVERFEIENAAERSLPDGSGREFDFRLRPRGTAVTAVPSFSFVYYKPGVIPPGKGYQLAVAPSIPLNVRPRAAVRPTEVEGPGEPMHVPERFYELVEGAGVLHRASSPARILGSVATAALLVLPPVLCVLWYVLWARRHPDEARRARQQRSRASRQALRGLRRGRAGVPAEEAVVIVTRYLHERFALPAAEATPAEVGAHLGRVGAAPQVVQKLAEFFRASDAARFAPNGSPAAEDWSAAARSLILMLEGAPWPSSLS